MAIVHDVNLPDDLYEQLQELATAENNSINAQVITLLRNALSAAQIKKIAEEQKRKDLAKLLEESRRRREHLPTDVEWPDSTALIREDRDR